MNRFGVACGLLAALWCGSASAQETKSKTDAKTEVKALAPSLKHLDGLPFVLVADGVGGSTAAGDALKRVAREDHVPLVVWPIPWSRQGRAALDLTDVEAHMTGAARIIDVVHCIRKECPRSSIILLGYSAGSHVVLLAAQSIPEKNVDRVILMGATVSSCYDLTVALKTARFGIDSYWSDMDTVLEIAADNFGTSDGQRGPCAGRVGFHVPKEVVEKNAALFARLHQCKWTEGMGGFGGHYSYVRDTFVRRTLLPSLFVTETVVETQRDK